MNTFEDDFWNLVITVDNAGDNAGDAVGTGVDSHESHRGLTSLIVVSGVIVPVTNGDT